MLAAAAVVVGDDDDVDDVVAVVVEQLCDYCDCDGFVVVAVAVVDSGDDEYDLVGREFVGYLRTILTYFKHRLTHRFIQH